MTVYQITWPEGTWRCEEHLPNMKRLQVYCPLCPKLSLLVQARLLVEVKNVKMFNWRKKSWSFVIGPRIVVNTCKDQSSLNLGLVLMSGSPIFIWTHVIITWSDVEFGLIKYILRIVPIKDPLMDLRLICLS